MNDMHYEEIRLSRALMRALEKDKFRINLEAYEAYRALIELYERQMEEGVQ